jgi:hypothetical protein
VPRTGAGSDPEVHVIEAGVEEKIDLALKGRLGQRPLVDRLGEAWTELTRGFTELVSAAEDVGRPVGGAPSADTEARAAIAAVLAGLGDGPAPTRRLTDRIRNVEQLIEAVRARIGRDTVNIGVVGSTKAGKSTLLRTITGLPDTVIPTTQFNPTTAAASRIYHTRNRPTAVLRLHTWESFRDSYLAPLHQSANLDAPPRQPADFRQYRYPVPGSHAAGAAGADDYLRKLGEAQTSFGSYERLLTGSSRTLDVGFERLRPFVAYPDKKESDPPDVRPYHAVRDVRIDQRFPGVTDTSLGLIDLPGAGEAGLDIDTQFVQRVKNEIDFLLMVKRGGVKSAAYLAEDSYALRLADSARGGAALEDFYAVVVNRDADHDPDGEYFRNTLGEVRGHAKDRRITVFGADVIKDDDVAANLLKPVFDHLAATLARMDRANIDAVLLEAGQTAAEVARFAEAVAAEATRRLRTLPNQKTELRRLGRELLREVAKSLYALREQYDDLVRSDVADASLTRGIDAAVRAANQWVEAGLGEGSTGAWFAAIEGAWVVGERGATEEQYYRATAQITKFFADVDASLAESIHLLWNRVADTLRSHLTAELVPVSPTGETALTHLRETADRAPAPVIHEALVQLLKLRVEYGSIVLRVTRPIIRAIDPTDDPGAARREAAAAVRAALVDAVVDGGASLLGSPIAVADVARKTYQWVRQPDGSRRKVPIGPDAPTAPASVPAATAGTTPSVPSPRAPVGVPQTAPPGTVELYAELTTRTRDTIDQLEKKLTEEAHTMAEALAAATDAFFQSMVRTNDVAWEYEELCGPYRREIWSEEFGGGASRLAADVSALQKQAQVLVTAVNAINEQRTALPRLP